MTAGLDTCEHAAYIDNHSEYNTTMNYCPDPWHLFSSHPTPCWEWSLLVFTQRHCPYHSSAWGSLCAAVCGCARLCVLNANAEINARDQMEEKTSASLAERQSACLLAHICLLFSKVVALQTTACRPRCWGDLYSSPKVWEWLVKGYAWNVTTCNVIKDVGASKEYAASIYKVNK